ncbi:hypothetical protein D1AOALGA4SA_10789 [Olavius algarvensis Delta 1 endosymbiont]|nr:hypothetical protein D1AOALGA4SA_10789 [Olavius algarvensis Delta 1 endosymbiont]
MRILDCGFRIEKAGLRLSAHGLRYSVHGLRVRVGVNTDKFPQLFLIPEFRP